MQGNLLGFVTLQDAQVIDYIMVNSLACQTIFTFSTS